MNDTKPYPSVPAVAEPPVGVTVELKVNGRAVKGFPWRQFADKREMTQADAMRVLALWMELAAK